MSVIASRSRSGSAVTEYAEQLSMTFWVSGTVRQRGREWSGWLDRVLGVVGRGHAWQVRIGSSDDWRPWADDAGVFQLLGRLAYPAGNQGPWRLQIADALGAPGRSAFHIEVLERPAFGGQPRLSHVRVLLPLETPAQQLTALAEQALACGLVWWGSVAPVVVPVSGHPLNLARRMAAAVKRHWCLLIEDVETLQWDGVDGLPALPWLTLLGRGFIESKGLTLDGLAAQAEALRSDGVFLRRSGDALMLAAGAHPIGGDINAHQSLAAYVALAEVLDPLLLKRCTPWVGVLSSEEVLEAWLGRFKAPQTWLTCDLDTP